MRVVSLPVVMFALRVPFAVALTTAMLAPLGAFSWSPFRGMLEGLFDVTAWGALWVTLAGWLSAAASWICAVIILNYGPRRFPGVGRAPVSGADSGTLRPFLGAGAAAAIAPLSVLTGVVAVSADRLAVLAGAFGGTLVFGLLWLTPRPPLGGSLRVAGMLARVVAADPAGYRDPATGHLLAGHRFVAQFAALFLTLYAAVGLLKFLALRAGWAAAGLPPSLAYVLLLSGLLALLFSGLSFCCDRYRIPVLLPWFALLALSSLAPSSDHVVETVELRGKPALAQPEVLMTGTPSPVLVCASGGGIQAAAWTALVLSELQRESEEKLASSIKLFSAASGGSVGGMHFLAAPSDGASARAFAGATRSSLDAVAWGLAGPDLVRAAVPGAGRVLGSVGRGWALGRAWDPAGHLQRPLSEWRPGQPAVVFNATEVESGAGVALGNVDLRPHLSGFEHRFMRRKQFVDISLVAGARLSASFPYVTPAPRAGSRTAHYADGGYYDNYGVGAAVAFLQRAYEHPRPGLARRVLVVEIRASATAEASAAAVRRSPPMLFQWFAPLATLLHVRDAAQRDRNDLALDLLGQALAARGVTLRRVVFESPRSEVPLSWHLTRAQVEAVRQDWIDRFANSSETRAVTEFVTQR